MRGNGASFHLQMRCNGQLVTRYPLQGQGLIRGQKPAPYRVRQQSASSAPGRGSRQNGRRLVVAVWVMKPGSEHHGAAAISSKHGHLFTYCLAAWQGRIGIVEEHQVLR